MLKQCWRTAAWEADVSESHTEPHRSSSPSFDLQYQHTRNEDSVSLRVVLSYPVALGWGDTKSPLTSPRDGL
jgi:hypothetical protein